MSVSDSVSPSASRRKGERLVRAATRVLRYAPADLVASSRRSQEMSGVSEQFAAAFQARILAKMARCGMTCLEGQGQLQPRHARSMPAQRVRDADLGSEDGAVQDSWISKASSSGRAGVARRCRPVSAPV